MVDPGILSLITHINTEAISVDAKSARGQVKNLSITCTHHLYNATEQHAEKHPKESLDCFWVSQRAVSFNSSEFWSFQFLSKRQSLAHNGKTDSPELLSRGAESCMNVSAWRQPWYHFTGTLSGVNQENSTLCILFKHSQIIVVLCHRPKRKLNLPHNCIWYLQAFLNKERQFILDLKKILN